MINLKSLLKPKFEFKKNVIPNKIIAKNKANPEEKPMIIKLLDGIITASILLIFLLCPLFLTGLAAQGAGFEKNILFYFLVLIGIIVWATKGVVSGELNLKRTPLDWPIIGLLAVYIISTVLSVNQTDSIIGIYGDNAKGLAALIIFILFYYLTVNNINTKKVKALFWAFTVSSALIIFFSLLQISNIFIIPWEFTRVINFNPIGSFTGLSIFIMSVLPLLVIAATQTNNIHPRLKKYGAIFIKLITGLAVIASLVLLSLLKGYSFWLVAIVGMIIVLMFLIPKIIKITNNNLIIPILVFLVLIVFAVLGNYSFYNINLPAEVALSRQASWAIAKNSLKADPVFGSGPSTFYYSFSKYKDVNFNYENLWNLRFGTASGSIFEFLATVGIAGVLLIVIISLIALSLSFLTLIKTKTSELQSILLALFASLVSILIFNLLFALNSSLILISILIAVLTVSSAIIIYPEEFRTFNLSFRSSPKYALALAVIFLTTSSIFIILFTSGIKTYLADIYARQSLTAADLGQKISLLEKAKTLVPYQDVYYLNLANYYSSLANQAATNNNQAQIVDNLNLAVDYGKKAVALSPNKVGNNEALAMIYENAALYAPGYLDMADKTYEKVLELEPHNPVSYLRLALIDMARSNLEQDKDKKAAYINSAIKKYDKALVEKTNLDAAYYGKAIANERLANLDEAIANASKAFANSNSNIDYAFELGRLYFTRGVIQPNIAQTATNELTAGEEAGGDLSVATDQVSGSKIKRNDDLNTAEQIFKSILANNEYHANAQYSLALLYLKIGENGNSKIYAEKLLNTIQDEAQKKTIKEQFKEVL